MVTKELIQREIDSVGVEYLTELYDLIKHFTQSKRQARKPTLMSKLKCIRIDAAEDFSARHDEYVTGEKRVESNLH